MYEEDKSDEENSVNINVLMTDGDYERKRNSTILEPKISSMIIKDPATSSVVEEEHLESDSQ